MSQVPAAIGTASANVDGTVDIVCDEHFMTRAPGGNNDTQFLDLIWDSRFPTMPTIWVPAGAGVCGQSTLGATLETQAANGPHNVIILCPRALQDPTKRTIGD